MPKDDWSEEDKQQFFEYMESLKEKDPEAHAKMYASFMSAMIDAAQDEAKAKGAIPEGQEDQFEKLREEYKKMAESGQPLQMPGSKVMGASGLEDKVAGLHITPRPGFVIKTKNAATEDKVFINICIHEELAEPHLKKRLDNNGEEVEGMNIPLSVGPPRAEKDKAGADCSVVDVIVNPKVIDDCNDDNTGQFRDFVCHLGIQATEQKYSMTLDKRYKLPKLKYHGTVQEQMIKDLKKMPKIEEVQPKTKPKAKKKEKVVPVAPPKLDVTLPCLARFAEVVSKELQCDLGGIEIDPSLTISTSGEYREPMMVPADNLNFVEFIAEAVGISDLYAIDFQLSTFKLTLKIPSYRMVTLYLPCAVLPDTASLRVDRVPGSVGRFLLMFSVKIDRKSWDTVSSDPGSKQWLLAHALSDEQNSNRDAGASPYTDPSGNDEEKRTKTMDVKQSKRKEGDNNDDDDDEDILPEDRFHIRMPKNVDPYTGIKISEEGDESVHTKNMSESYTPNDDDVELPEDKFHRKDAASSYIIQQREQGIKDKQASADKDREARKNDPNVEYIDVEDFQPGGKYGPPVADKSLEGEVAHDSHTVTRSADDIANLTKASTVLQDQVSNELGLSSNLWTELLD